MARGFNVSSRIRSSLYGLVVGTVLFTLLLTIAGPGWAPPLIKMGVVNWEQVVMQFDQFQKEQKELQRRRMKILQYIQEESKGKVPNPEDIESGENLDPEMQKIYQDTLKQIEDRRRSLQEEFHQKINAAIRDEAIARGFSLVLSENEVLYASEEYTDLTNGVIERLNKEKSD